MKQEWLEILVQLEAKGATPDGTCHAENKVGGSVGTWTEESKAAGREAKL